VLTYDSYYAQAALRLLQRSQSIEMWADESINDTEIAIALAGFDNFSLLGGNDIESVRHRNETKPIGLIFLG
jgi:hypothetical protein